MRSRLIVTCAVVALVAGALGVSSVTAAPAPAQPTNVVVVNNPFTQPVPVAGTVAISSSPTQSPVWVRQSGPVAIDASANTVKLDPSRPLTATVGVLSSAASPVYTREAGTDKEPVRLYMSETDRGNLEREWNFGRHFPGRVEPFTVPAGRWFVAKSISIKVRGSDNPDFQVLEATLYATPEELPQGAQRGTPLMLLPLESRPQRDPWWVGYGATLECDLLFAPGEKVSVYVVTNQAEVAGKYLWEATAYMTGYLVDHP